MKLKILKKKNDTIYVQMKKLFKDIIPVYVFP